MVRFAAARAFPEPFEFREETALREEAG